MDGVLNVLKPTGMTSFDVVAYIRRLAGVKKVGHCGTLDPAAAGVLPICVGAATGLSDYLSSSGKSYRAEILFGVHTDSIDLDGAVVRSKRIQGPDRQAISRVLSGFIGKQYQTPPMYSAIKADGKRLYELARKGIEVKREAREVTIYSLRLVWVMKGRAVIEVDCSKGTYIRSLCEDIGKKLGVDACMSFLIRTCSSGLLLSNAYTLEQLGTLGKSGRLEEAAIPIENMLTGFPGCILSDAQLKRFMNGADIDADVDGFATEDGDKGACNENLVKVFDRKSAFYALGKVVSVNGQDKLRVKKLFRKIEGIL